MLSDKKIVITGGAGFIGCNLAKELSTNNEVIIVDNLTTGKFENISNLDVNFQKISINDLELLNATFKNADFVFHQAAIPSVPRSIQDPLSTNFANIDGTLKVLLAARDNSVQKVILASSSSVYGNTPFLPKVETMCPNPLSPYATTKLTLEFYAKQFFNIYNLSTTCLRYFNVYGPFQDPTSVYTGVISKFFTNALNNKPLIIFGDGEQSRDFTFIDDVVQANLKTCLSTKANGEVINIACGSKITINRLANEIINVTDSSSDIIYEKARNGDIEHSLADIFKAKELIDYKPVYTLKEGLEKTYNWFISS
jgi:UDP-glucose 4-epimerase